MKKFLAILICAIFMIAVVGGTAYAGSNGNGHGNHGNGHGNGHDSHGNGHGNGHNGHGDKGDNGDTPDTPDVPEVSVDVPDLSIDGIGNLPANCDTDWQRATLEQCKGLPYNVFSN